MNGVLLLLVCALGAALAWALRREWRARGRRADVRARAVRGHAAEEAAGARLVALGYTVIARHPEARYVFTVDGAPTEARLTADYLVTRHGQTLLVEVKTGGATRITRRTTRRQLLEYALHFAVDGVLLYDADADTVHTVTFPAAAPGPEGEADRGRPFAWGLALGLALGLLAWALAH
ncbi:MAG: hypothetical protein H6702_04805 [Myxococcales bacterium]|nr:hypothetical protein [Myxococcales bacterium]